MQANNRNGFIGILLALIGFILLCYNFDWIELNSQFMWGLGFVVMGVALIVRYKKVDTRIILLIVGLGVAIIGFIIILDSFDLFPDDIIATVFLWIIGALFIALHFRDTRYWWPIIPGGILFVLGMIVLIDSFNLLDGDYIYIIFFFGLGAIFWYLHFYRHGDIKLRWPVFPAVVLSAVAVIGLLEETVDDFWSLLLPVCLITIGVIMIFHQQRKIVSGESSDKI